MENLKVMEDLTMQERMDVIEKLMEENHISGEVVGYDEERRSVSVEITWGDWKHDHGWMDNLMWKTFDDLRSVHTATTEEDGSDCYSAIHFYYFS